MSIWVLAMKLENGTRDHVLTFHETYEMLDVDARCMSN